MKLAGTAWFGLMSTAAIIAMFLDFATYRDNEDPEVDAGMTTASITAESSDLDRPTFVIRGPGGGADCRAFPSQNGTSGHNTLTTDKKCAELYPPLANARTWHNNQDGTIDLADHLGRPIVVFSPGDGLAYISVEPRSVILSMSTEGVSLY
ncbi:hypothetical protein [Phyllobacterium lublinensis]|uniref:hypothetical protein n=1 Tax=Phyllobacterium lublinensis TaxID=2875708 RepID=UPI001CCF441D|nr:hypothetical protein [Phyllobacterium sp. 2063]MBZ9657327.1 hypothetical protein [Phyllobacterium sp. 2063]